jgi:hypothetical protein
MYTDEDLNFAVKKGIFTQSSLEEFRALLASSKHSPSVDEENFKLIGGFNDIFIVIACALLLFCSRWVISGFNEPLSLIVFAGLSWGLAEYFVLKRKMALPAIALLLAFVGSSFSLGSSFFPSHSEAGLLTGATVATIAAFIHWRRFRVPITIAVGVAAAVGIIVSSVLYTYPTIIDKLSPVFFISGLVTFTFAMFWDASDTKRITYKSDVAFWLHLLSAPLIIHPIFSGLGILAGNENLFSLAIVLLLYLVMTSVSLSIDRRAFMVSSLIYVIYALSTIIKNYGGIGYSFAVTGVIIGAALLLLSAYWQPARARLVSHLPVNWQRKLPITH